MSQLIPSTHYQPKLFYHSTYLHSIDNLLSFSYDMLSPAYPCVSIIISLLADMESIIVFYNIIEWKRSKGFLFLMRRYNSPWSPGTTSEERPSSSLPSTALKWWKRYKAKSAQILPRTHLKTHRTSDKHELPYDFYITIYQQYSLQMENGKWQWNLYKGTYM